MAVIVFMVKLYVLQSEVGGSALTEACKEGHADVARILLERSAVVDYRDKVRTRNVCASSRWNMSHYIIITSWSHLYRKVSLLFI